jgi:hypothetical protein
MAKAEPMPSSMDHLQAGSRNFSLDKVTIGCWDQQIIITC